MSSIVIAGDTSGSVTLQAPAVAGSSVLSLPAVTDTVAGIAATQTLTNKSIVATQLTGTIAAARLPAGTVLQVVHAKIVSQTSTSSTTYADTGLTATITPSSASNKILVIVSQYLTVTGGTSAGYGYQTNIGVKLLRNSTDLIVPASDGGGKYSLGMSTGIAPATGIIVSWGNASFNYLDSPATTSATTYKTQFAKGLAGMGTMYTNDNGGGSFITLMEIAA